MSLCKCGTIREKHTASQSAAFPGRQYYKCTKCSAFEWADQSPAKVFNNKAGPLCKCEKSSVQRAVTKQSPDKGRKFWTCAKGREKGCKFFKWVEEDETSKAKSAGINPHKLNLDSKKRPPLPGYVTYLPDWKKVEVLQSMMEVDPSFMVRYTDSRYDSVDVVGVWQITNKVQQEKFNTARSSITKEEDTQGSLDYDIPDSYKVPMNELANNPLDSKAGEVFLLHGTKPENLHSILFEGHQTALANKNGLFGKGIYFAENSAKIDQYATTDDRYQMKGEKAELHEKIYKECKGSMHQKNVRYALVCRVLLGRHVASSDGRTRIVDGKDVFTSDGRNALAEMEDGEIPNSLIGIPGERARKFREFIVYDENQVLVEYLVAYKRVKNLCNCGEKYLERTVHKQTENYGRKIHVCAKGKCSPQMLPLCNCGIPASVKKVKKSGPNQGRDFFCCGKRYGGRCDFFEFMLRKVQSEVQIRKQGTLR